MNMKGGGRAKGISVPAGHIKDFPPLSRHIA